MLKLTDLMPSVIKLIPYDYQAIKNTTFEQILNKALSFSAPQSRPCFIQVSGIPGSGKSTLCQRHAQGNQVMISFDAIMEQLPEYQKDIERCGNKAAFQKWEIPARVAGYELLRRAVSRKYNICLEHSGVNPAHLELLQNLKKYGFSTEVDFILCPLNLALSRIKEREAITRRHTPESQVRERFIAAKQYLSQYQQIADKTIVYDARTLANITTSFPQAS